MNFSFLTYNTLFNDATNKIDEIINTYHPDIICFQEILTEDANFKKIEKLGYNLADYSNSFIKFRKIFGVATFYNRNKFDFVMSDSLKISSNLTELLFTIPQIIFGVNKPKTVLRTDFIDKSSKKKFTICNAHLIVVASNSLRINHIGKALKSLNLNKITPLIIGGDFNYLPYQRKKLETFMEKYNLVEATKNISQTVKFSKNGRKEHYNFFQNLVTKIISKLFSNNKKYDYVFYRGLTLEKTERIEVRFSDHYPIISEFSL
jgi:endonuclease/exonuclease/phosphatase family metal-dependent hydrolase